MDQLSLFTSWIGGDAIGPDNGDPFLVEEEKEEDRGEQVQRLLQEFSVLLEYERMRDLMPPGMYIIPSFESALTWHGTLFVRQGLYRGGVFKFELVLPGDYPESPPALRFLTKMFHPMVESGTGRIDVGAVFPEWRAGRDYASFLLPHLHRSLLRREYFSGSARKPLNIEARDLFIKDPAAFAERAAKCAQASLESAHQNATGFSLKFASGPAEAHDEILDALRGTDATAPLEDRKIAFVDWFCDHYANERVHVGVDTGKPETILVPREPQEVPESEQS